MENRYEKILKNKEYRELLAEIHNFELERIYCKHDLRHFMDVARIASIIWFEDGEDKGIDRDIIYAAALLHDIGRAREYKEGLSHDEASAVIAEHILPSCGYTAEEIQEISSAIHGHRGRKYAQETYLGEILARADKLSRPCFLCGASDTCKWSEEEKNTSLAY